MRRRWSLSPAYDLNPVPEIERAQMPKTCISEDHNDPTIAGVLVAAPRFGLKPAKAKATLREVGLATANWRAVGKTLRISSRTLGGYASAFEHPLMDEAKRLS